jgi:hypothetical protein
VAPRARHQGTSTWDAGLVADWCEVASLVLLERVAGPGRGRGLSDFTEGVKTGHLEHQAIAHATGRAPERLPSGRGAGRRLACEIRGGSRAEMPARA